MVERHYQTIIIGKKTLCLIYDESVPRDVINLVLETVRTVTSGDITFQEAPITRERFVELGGVEGKIKEGMVE